MNGFGLLGCGPFCRESPTLLSRSLYEVRAGWTWRVRPGGWDRHGFEKAVLDRIVPIDDAVAVVTMRKEKWVLGC